MKITILPSEYEGLSEFYDVVAEKMGYDDTSEIKYDCRKINIAENIQDRFYECYNCLARETDPTLSENDIKTGTTILLAMSGPKVDKTLKANEVEVFDGFILLNNTKLITEREDNYERQLHSNQWQEGRTYT